MEMIYGSIALLAMMACVACLAIESNSAAVAVALLPLAVAIFATLAGRPTKLNDRSSAR